MQIKWIKEFIGGERGYMTGTGKLNLLPRREEIWVYNPCSVLKNINIIGRQSASSEVTALSLERSWFLHPFIFLAQWIVVVFEVEEMHERRHQKAKHAHPGMLCELLHYFLAVNHNLSQAVKLLKMFMNCWSSHKYRQFLLALFLVAQFLQDRRTKASSDYWFPF